jgi:hypothetical protein
MVNTTTAATVHFQSPITERVVSQMEVSNSDIDGACHRDLRGRLSYRFLLSEWPIMSSPPAMASGTPNIRARIREPSDNIRTKTNDMVVQIDVAQLHTRSPSVTFMRPSYLLTMVTDTMSLAGTNMSRHTSLVDWHVGFLRDSIHRSTIQARRDP